MRPAFCVVLLGVVGRDAARAARPRARPRSFSRHSASSHIRSSAAPTGPSASRRARVEAVLVIAAARDEPCGAQGAELQRDGAERDIGHRRVDSPCRELLVPDQPQDFAAARGGDRRQDGGADVHRNQFR